MQYVFLNILLQLLPDSGSTLIPNTPFLHLKFKVTEVHVTLNKKKKKKKWLVLRELNNCV